MSNEVDKFSQSIVELELALKLRERALSEHVIYAGIAKCFEVSLEYGWKHLKRKLEEKGIEAYAPKDVVREAGRAGLIDDVEAWIRAINIRNFAVHDYLGVTPKEYLATIAKFIPNLRALK